MLAFVTMDVDAFSSRLRVVSDGDFDALNRKNVESMSISWTSCFSPPTHHNNTNGLSWQKQSHDKSFAAPALNSVFFQLASAEAFGIVTQSTLFLAHCSTQSFWTPELGSKVVDAMSRLLQALEKMIKSFKLNDFGAAGGEAAVAMRGAKEVWWIKQLTLTKFPSFNFRNQLLQNHLPVSCRILNKHSTPTFYF